MLGVKMAPLPTKDLYAYCIQKKYSKYIYLPAIPFITLECILKVLYNFIAARDQTKQIRR